MQLGLHCGQKWDMVCDTEPGRRGSSHPAVRAPQHHGSDPNTRERPGTRGATLTFRGVYDHTLDSKNRLTIPRPYQDVLRSGVVLAIPPDRKPCIWIAREEDYERYTSSALAELSPLSDARLELERFFFGNSRDLKLDGRERVMLPPHMLDHARLEREASDEPREVVIVGAGQRLECWERGAWAEHQHVLLSRAGEMTEEARR